MAASHARNAGAGKSSSCSERMSACAGCAARGDTAMEGPPGAGLENVISPFVRWALDAPARTCSGTMWRDRRRLVLAYTITLVELA
jgi:hypothetical protein